MQIHDTVADEIRRWVGSLLIVLMVAGVAAFLVWPFVTIRLRLSKNSAISRQLVQALQTRFPGVSFRGAASYEMEVIYIDVGGPVDEPTRREVEQWLREQKTEQEIRPEVWLGFGEDFDESTTIKLTLLEPRPRRTARPDCEPWRSRMLDTI
jgi:hypothetical protein